MELLNNILLRIDDVNFERDIGFLKENSNDYGKDDDKYPDYDLVSKEEFITKLKTIEMKWNVDNDNPNIIKLKLEGDDEAFDSATISVDIDKLKTAYDVIMKVIEYYQEDITSSLIPGYWEPEPINRRVDFMSDCTSWERLLEIDPGIYLVILEY